MHSLEAALAANLAAHDWCAVTALVGVSGGADSVALLRGLLAVAKPGAGRLMVAHFNHELRGDESAADERFVRELAQELGLQVTIGRPMPGQIQARTDSLEASARDARYAFFSSVAKTHGARYLFLAHNADDQAETILHRIVRGTGLSGLAGIPATRALSEMTTIVRPLLNVRRAQIVDYLSFIGQSYRTDSTNADVSLTRNRLRHELLPHLAEHYNPQVSDALCQLGAVAKDASAVIEAQVASWEPAIIVAHPRELRLNVRQLQAASPFLLCEFLLRQWQALHWPLQGMTFDKWRELAALVVSDRDQTVMFPGAIRAQKQGETLVLSRPE